MIPEPFTLGELHEYLQQQASGTVYPPGRRVQVALATYRIVQDHHAAIAVLVERGLYASAFALSRALYEATVKGLWLSYCADESRAEKYARGQELPALGELIEDLSRAELLPLVQAHLGNVKRRYWKALSSFAHAGHSQVQRWLSPTGVEPAYSEAEVREVIDFTAFFSVVAMLERVRLGSNESAVAAISSVLPSTE